MCIQQKQGALKRDFFHAMVITGNTIEKDTLTRALRNSMPFKQLIIAILMISGLGSTQAMNMVDPTFKEHLEKALVDFNAYTGFKYHFINNMCDVDTLCIEPGKTVGQLIDEALLTNTQKALFIAQVVQCRRTDRGAVIRTLYRAYEEDSMALWYLKDWLDIGRYLNFYDPGDIDSTDYDTENPGKTIGDRIAEHLSMSEKAQKKGVLAAVFGALRSLADVHVSKPTDDSTGKDKTKSMNELRKKALDFAKLAQYSRSNKHSVSVTLFKAYENDPTLFADLKEWQDFVKADVRTIYYDASKTRTLAQRIDALKRDDVSNLFKISNATLTKPNPILESPPKSNNDDKKAKWSMGKTLGVTALVASAGLLYYYMSNKDSKKNLVDQPQALEKH